MVPAFAPPRAIGAAMVLGFGILVALLVLLMAACFGIIQVMQINFG